jgi:hypothetical protein
MTFLGKVLVVVQLILSVMFMAFAGAVFTAQKNWRDDATKAKTALTAAQSKATADQTAMQSQIDTIQKELTALKNDKVTLEGQVKTLTDENARLDSDNKSMKTAFDGQRTIAELNSQEADERLKESQIQRARNVELNKSRDAVVTELNELRDKNFGTELKLAETVKRYEQLLRDNSTMRSFLAARNLPTDVKQMTALSAPPPPLDGRIEDARKEQKGNRVFVVISLGSDDGLVVGHTMTVKRADKYLGKVRLEDVRPDMSVGVVIETAPNSVIQKEDHVTTRI